MEVSSGMFLKGKNVVSMSMDDDMSISMDDDKSERGCVMN